MTTAAVRILLICVKIWSICGRTLREQKLSKTRIESLYGFQKEEMSV
jgi:hypothetical protein